MSDKLVFDLAQEVEGSPNVFIRKDWLNILDNQNQNYNNNQSVIDTSQLSNSNKYMSYREAYLSIPFVVTLASTSITNSTASPTLPIAPAGGLLDYSIGLKNWFGQIIHSFTLDYNGTTIIQQTPYINMWNSFKLMTSLSLDDVNTQGATIGFFPDDPLAWGFNSPVAPTLPAGYAIAGGSWANGQGVYNNQDFIAQQLPLAWNNFRVDSGNLGYVRRQNLINFDQYAPVGINANYATLVSSTPLALNNGAGLATGGNTAFNNVWKNYISATRNSVAVANGLPAPDTANADQAYIQYSIVATVYLKHIHSFFNMCPLLKGVFMKMTMNLNNTTSTITTRSTASLPSYMMCSSVQNPLGGVNPLMITSGGTSALGTGYVNGGYNLFGTTAGLVAGNIDINYTANISVGATCLNSTLASIVGQSGALSRSIYLYVPAYTFNPVFEQAYLSSPVKAIKYTDVYQYQVLGVQPSQPVTQLLTNGIANVKSVLVLPFYSSNIGSGVTVNTVSCSPNSGFIQGTPVFQSPFDPAGTGPTSPLCLLSNFNIQVSGQNAIYNTQKYNFEQFNNQLYGQNAVNGGLTDGITSGLIDRQHFDMEYCYYYVNVERMLPVEQSVPKSIQLLATNYSSKYLDFYCFVEYGNEISIDILTGARV